MRRPGGDELARLVDLEAIRELPRRYADCVWRKDADGAAELFWPDAVMDTGMGEPLQGREAIRAAYRATFPTGELWPFVHNHVIELDGERASGRCALDLRATLGGRSLIGAGSYEDRYERRDGVWRFRSRRLRMAFLVAPSEGWAGAGGAGG